MKKILILLFSLIATAAIGQYPINQILSSDSTMVSIGRNATGGIRGGLVNMVFPDTTAANLSRIAYYTGAQIWTTTDSAIWVRFKGTPSFWVKMAGASGGTTGSFWNITGNYFGGGVPLNYGVGTNSYDYLPLKTNNITRLLIPPDGILRSSAPANKYLMMDTTTLEMYYGDGGGGSTWQQTLTAGSTLTGNNTIDGGLNSIDFADFNGFAITVRNNSGIEFNGYNGAKRSAISVAGDSIVLKLNNSGNFYIDSLQNVSTQSVLLGGTSNINNRKIGYLNIGTGLSLSSGTLNSVWTASGNDVYNNNSGNVGIGTSSPDSLLTVELGIRGKRGARFDGLPTFADTTNYKPVVINSSGTLYKATYWPGGGGGSGWSLTGNAGTNPASNFIGTTDGQPLMFRYNNQNAGSIGKEGMHTYLGIEAGENDVSGGDPNIGIGSYVLSSNTTGDGNSAVGGFVLGINTTGYYNSAVGVSALYSNTTGYYNSAVGVSALYSNTTGYYNSAVGASALGSNTTGYYNSAVGASAGNNAKQKPDAVHQILIGAGTYGTRDSISVIGANFIKETIVRGKLIDSTLSAGAGTKAVRWNSSTGEFTYADTTVGGGGGSPAGSNKELQFNNSGSFGGTTGIKYGNATNERLSIWQQSSSDVPLTIRTAGDNSKAAIEIKDTTNQPYTSAIKFTPSAAGSPKASMIYQGYEGLYLDGGCAPYTTADGATVVIGNSTGSVAPFKVHSYPYDVPASPNNWVAKIRTSKTSAVGLAIDWGAAGQTGDLLQFRKNDNTVLSRFDSVGNLGLGVAPTTKLDVGGTFAARQGADVASANNLAVISNSVEITGTTQINLIANTGWVNGSQITLLLASGITIKNGQTTSGSNITILLDGAADFVTSAASSLTLLLCEVGGTQAWREISRRSY